MFTAKSARLRDAILKRSIFPNGRSARRPEKWTLSDKPNGIALPIDRQCSRYGSVEIQISATTAAWSLG